MVERRLGIAVIGLGGAVGTTMVAGIELLKRNKISKIGLPLAKVRADLINYEQIVFSGWDLFSADLAKATKTHAVLTYEQFMEVEETLKSIKPMPAIADSKFLEIKGDNHLKAKSHIEKINQIRSDLQKFKQSCSSVVVINLASTERIINEDIETFKSLEKFEQAILANSEEISPAMLYAYASIAEKIPYANFTPSVAAEIPALIEFSEKQGVPIAGKDGKTGQTFIKTVLAPALKSRALRIIGWYSTNILGNRDGLVLSNEASLASKIKTKSSVLNDILGYEVEDHIVDIRYYRPRGDNKEAWDNIDFLGFLEQPMQIKINFLCKDSILAAPLAIEIARCLDLAQRTGEKGIQKQLSVFFKSPMNQDKPEHAFHVQEKMLLDWLERTTSKKK
jgi:myo-inositol-1-phosphate synthase